MRASHKRPNTLAESGMVRWLCMALVICAVTAGTLTAVSAFGTKPIAAVITPSHPQVAGADTPPPVVPLAVIGTNPTATTGPITAGATVTVSLSTSLAPTSALPYFLPNVPGTWSWLSATELEFVAAGPFTPGATETMVIPGGPTGLHTTQGETLPSSTTIKFKVAAGSILRLQQLLAELGYLPVSFTPNGQIPTPQQEADPQQGTFAWRWSTLPATLDALWTPGTNNVITKGAIMEFETQHNMTTDGVPGAGVWAALLKAVATGAGDSTTWNYVHVSETLPETVVVYQNGNPVYSTLANTGQYAAPTQKGTFPVYLRFQVTTMSGTNPTGSHYVDPGIPWVSYFNGGDALHGYIRYRYGYPQSDGCVEMPPTNAKVVWPYTPVGTLVTVA